MILLSLLACSLVEPPPAGLSDYGEVPTFSLTDQAGVTTTRESLAGRVWLADFFFTSCPDVCPVLSAHMAEVQGHYRDNPDFHLVSISVDPGTDTPPVLATYATRVGALPGRWTFLTGPADDIKRVVVDGFKQYVEITPGTGLAPPTILHGSRFVLVDRKGHIRAYPDPAEPGKVELYRLVDAVLAGR